MLWWCFFCLCLLQLNSMFVHLSYFSHVEITAFRYHFIIQLKNSRKKSSLLIRGVGNLCFSGICFLCECLAKTEQKILDMNTMQSKYPSYTFSLFLVTPRATSWLCTSNVSTMSWMWSPMCKSALKSATPSTSIFSSTMGACWSLLIGQLLLSRRRSSSLSSSMVELLKVPLVNGFKVFVLSVQMCQVWKWPQHMWFFSSSANQWWCVPDVQLVWRLPQHGLVRRRWPWHCSVQVVLSFKQHQRA